MNKFEYRVKLVDDYLTKLNLSNDINNYFKGRKHTDETKKKISESIKQKARGIRVRVNDQEFYSLKAAATYVEVSPSTIARYSKSGKKLIKNGNKFSISVV